MKYYIIYGVRRPPRRTPNPSLGLALARDSDEALAMAKPYCWALAATIAHGRDHWARERGGERPILWHAPHGRCLFLPPRQIPIGACPMQDGPWMAEHDGVHPRRGAPCVDVDACLCIPCPGERQRRGLDPRRWLARHGIGVCPVL